MLLKIVYVLTCRVLSLAVLGGRPQRPREQHVMQAADAPLDLLGGLPLRRDPVLTQELTRIQHSDKSDI